MFTREELEPLAKTNVESLKDFDYFTIARVNGKKADFLDPPSGYYLDYKDQILTLHFMLPLKTPLKAQELQIEIYDPSYFVDFSFEKDKRSRWSARRPAARCWSRARRRWTRRRPRSCSRCRPTRSSIRRNYSARSSPTVSWSNVPDPRGRSEGAHGAPRASF